MSSFKRSVSLLRASHQVMTQHHKLLWLPIFFLGLILLSAALALAIVVGAILLYATLFAPGVGFNAVFRTDAAQTVIALTMLVAMFTTGLFANATTYQIADAALRGESLALRRAVKNTWKNRKYLLQWALFALGVNWIIEQIASNVPFVAAMITRVFGAAWSLAIIFVVPVLINRGVGPIEAVKQSAQLFKKSWKENVVGGIGIGVIALLFLIIPLMIVAAGVGLFIANTSGLAPVIALIGFGIILLILVGSYISSVNTIFLAALYRYADTGDYMGPFTQEMLQGTFRAKGSKDGQILFR
jgi:hypothetical protein